ncbi:MAG: hypothetical protein HY259_00095 [Chloroflexi bacterium]|nr:hypothetical protein [Chloroflexota bacterium]
MVDYGVSYLLKDKIIVGCPQNDADIRLYLWAPQTRSTFEDIQLRLATFYGENYFRPLIEVTKLNVPTFYQTFKNPNNQTCIETPDAIWPG